MDNHINKGLFLGILLLTLALAAALYFWDAPENRPKKMTPPPVVPVPLGFIEQADQLIAEGKFEEAKGWLVSENFEGKEDAPRLLRLALLEFNERPDAAEALLQIALEADFNNVALYTAAASQLEAQQRVRLAQEIYQKAIELEPQNPKLYDALAEFYLKNNQSDLAFLTWGKALSLPDSAYLIPKVSFYAKVVQSADSKDETFWVATTPLEAKWLKVLQALKEEKYDQAAKVIQQGPQQTIRPDLEESILLALDYRKSRVLGLPSFNPQTPLQKELAALAQEKKEPPNPLKLLLKSPEIFSALLLDSGWDNAALMLNHYETVPEKYPAWFSLQLAQATKRVKGIEAAYLFALNQVPSPEINRLVAELEVAVAQPQQGLKSLLSARNLLKQGKLYEAREQYKKIENQSTEAKVFLIQLEGP